MLLSCRFLNKVADVNTFSYTNQLNFTQGDTPTIYLQIVDASVDLPSEGFNPPYRRYMPQVGATLKITLDNLNTSKKVVRFATQPFPLDPSIWSFPILSTDQIVGTVSVLLQLTEGGTVTNGTMIGGIGVNSQNPGIACCC
jgi:hypothetical protein